jgi:hypothetical protein
VLLEKSDSPVMVRIELDIDIAPPCAAEFWVKVADELMRLTVDPKVA